MLSDEEELIAVVVEVEEGEEAALLISFRRELLMELRLLAIDPIGLFRPSNLLSAVALGNEYGAGVGYNWIVLPPS